MFWWPYALAGFGFGLFVGAVTGVLFCIAVDDADRRANEHARKEES